LRKVGEDNLKFLIAYPSESRDATLSLATQVLNGLDLDRLYRDTDNAATRKREASNEWVLSGAHSVSGKPLLANDPHLDFSFPGTWYLARMVGPGFDIKGASSPGSPGIVLGHNASIGWGFTTTNLDSQDLFIERVDPTDPNRYITPDGARPFAVREETINVLWGEPVHLRVRNTRHGVVIDDFITKPEDFSPAGHVLALQATALDGGDTSIEAVAKGLAMSSRSLQRRLGDEGTRYNDLLAEIRSEFAKRYLARNTLSASEVAYLLGFTEPPAFFKAFKRWTGMTPREFQQAAPP